MARPEAPPRRAPGSTATAPRHRDRPSLERSLRQARADFGRHPLRDLLAVALGLCAGLSPLFAGYYADTAWPVVALGVVVIVGAMAALGRLPMPSTGPLVAVSALVGLGLLALVSALWSPSPNTAVVGAGRVLFYAAVVLLSLRLARRSRRRALLLGSLGVGLAAVAAVTVVGLLGSGAASMFLGGRLSDPLGYAGATGCALLLGAWLCIGLAVRPAPLEAGVGAFGAVLMACLAVLAESRSAVPATLLAVVAVLVVQRSARTAWAIVVTGAGVAVAFPVLNRAYASSSGQVSAGHAHAAALAALAAAAGAAVVWAAGTAVTDGVRARGGAVSLRRASRLGLAALGVLALLGAGAAAGPLSRGVKKEWRAFTQLTVVTPTNGSSRLLNAGGPLREYWRVALHTAADKPVAGAGEGAWPRVWFQERHYYDPVWVPNSIVFGTLAQLGALGGVLVATFVVGVAVAMWRARRRGDEPLSPSTVAAVGVAAAGLSFAATDWTWSGVPGVTAIGLIAVGAVLAASDRAERAVNPVRRGRSVPIAWRAGVAVVAVLAAVLLVRTAVGASVRESARRDLVADPAAAVDKANTSLAVNGADVWTDYVKAAALARVGHAGQARDALVAALHREPDNYVTWALLGDLDVRRGDTAHARAEDARAAELDPLDANSAAGIPADPQAAAGLGGPGPYNVGHRPHMHGFQTIKDTSPLELARALGAPGLRTGDVVVVGLFGYGVG